MNAVIPGTVSAKRDLLRRGVIWFLAILFPCLMLYPLRADFYVDWANYVWMIGYGGAYFRQHGVMPLVLNTPVLGGMPFPVFYGYMLVPLLGLPSAWIDPEIVIRLAAVGLFALQFFWVRRALVSLGSDRAAATAIACLVIWAIYPLTNLYNRSALTEFFATGMLTCAVCQWFRLLAAVKPGDMLRAALLFGLCFTLSAGISPITAMCSLPLLAVLALTLLTAPDWRSMGRRLCYLALAALGCAVVLAPWAYATHVHQHQMRISMDPNPYLFPFPQTIDWWVTRLFPLPFDIRALFGAPSEVSTPYLDAQMNLPLLLLVGFLGWRLLRGLPGRLLVRALVWLAVPVAYFGCTLALSLDGHLFDRLPSICKMVQFPYRLVTYINLAMLVTLLVVFRVVRRPGADNGGRPVLVPPVFLCFILTLSGAGVVEKLVHASVARIPWDHDLVKLPNAMYGFWAFATPQMLAPLDPAVKESWQPGYFEVEPRRAFGEYRPRTVSLDRSKYVLTQVQLFPWNRLYVDGQRVPDEELRSWGGMSRAADFIYPQGCDYGPCVAVPVPAGEHVIAYRFEPSRTWKFLYHMAGGALALWVVTLLVLWVRGLRRRQGVPAAEEQLPGLPVAA